ncbi:MAG: Lrp/AsnC family transcriptional regulator [Actinomycetaceae bacterium]|nr:Lrp/AsnC family transcriptional regulator [Actinomycetaceae bacterium]
MGMGSEGSKDLDFELDETFLKILDELRKDSRISVAALAEAVGISRSNAYSRLNALIESGVIERFTVEINPRLVGKKVSALVFVSLDQSKWKQFGMQLGQLEQMDYYAVTTGGYDAVLRLRADDVPGIQHAVVDVISQWSCVRDTETVFLMQEQSSDYALAPLDVETGTLDPMGVLNFDSAATRSLRGDGGVGRRPNGN